VSPGELRGPIIIDTDVFSADLVPRSRLTELYAPIVTGRPAFISFQTVAELRYGALHRGWGEARMFRLDAKIARAEIVHTGQSSSWFTLGCELTARRGATLWASVSTTPIVGSRRPRSVSGCLSSPRTGSSKSSSRRSIFPDVWTPASLWRVRGWLAPGQGKTKGTPENSRRGCETMSAVRCCFSEGGHSLAKRRSSHSD
jgi:hypothetical protein